MQKFLQLFVVLFSVCFASTAFAVKKGDDAPAFSIPSIDGGVVNIEEHEGKVVYLDFWASWCPPCLKSLPLLNEYYNDLDDAGFEIVAVNLDSDTDDARAFLKKKPVDYPVGIDTEGKTPKAYGVKAMPTSYIIDKKGVIRYVHKGFKPKDMKKIQKLVAELLAE